MNRQQAFLLFLVVASALVSLLLVVPLLEYVLAAIIFGYVLYPLHKRLRPRLGERLSPLVIVLASSVAVVLPLVYVAIVLYQDIRDIAAGQSGLRVGEIEQELPEIVAQYVDVSGLVERLGQELVNVVFGSVSQVLGVGSRLMIGIMLVLFLVYYVLKDGPKFARWTVNVIPMDDAVTYRLVRTIDRTTYGVVIGHIMIAIAQGVVGGIGLAVVGIPNYVFWTFVMIFLNLLPLIGAFLVWLPAAGYLFTIGDPLSAGFLLAYGFVAVGLIDNYARPLIIDQETPLNPGVIIVGVFGGLYAFGAIGMFVGPIVLGVLASTLTAYRRDYDALAGDTPPPQEPERTVRYSWLGEDASGPDDGRRDSSDDGTTDSTDTDS